MGNNLRKVVLKMIDEELAFMIPWVIGSFLAVLAIIIFIKRLRKK